MGDVGSVDLTLLRNALKRLDEGLARYERESHDAHIRDGLIQRFEFTYDLGFKTLRWCVAMAALNESAVDVMIFAETIRTADEQGLTAADWPTWKAWREVRNITSHTYDEQKALMAVAAIPNFAKSMRATLDRLEKRGAAV